ncbi:hypothetical protein HFP89_02020 [Wenzhouxiangella sp. XN79A]|uniref:SpvB/TcaC N-terminal domain-containing protein n=1 Tax=Wenzhouxiangella sp. XN79A TaxID=2724193 RepID=UPI00144A8078|nr:SpvB/TcaC N-terminal domain-containing protein [Wenzhouxiangella sp. XN79A]NKI33941.1 hypothetical protein [Wenzhouxiangella sp. XN79A]
MYAANNEIDSIPSVAGIGDLDLSSNLISTAASDFHLAPANCTGVCMAPEVTLGSLNLSGNDLGLEGNAILGSLGDFQNLNSLYVADTGLKRLSWIEPTKFAALRTIDLSANAGLLSIAELALLPGDHIALNASSLGIVGIDDGPGGGQALRLPVLASIQSLILNDSVELESLSGIGGFSNLQSLSVSNSKLAECEYRGYLVENGQIVPNPEPNCSGLDFIDELIANGIELTQLKLSGNRFNNLAPLHNYWDAYPYYRTMRAVVFWFQGELHLSCEGLHADGAGSFFGPSSCLPDPPSGLAFQIEQELTTGNVSWDEFGGQNPTTLSIAVQGEHYYFEDDVIDPELNAITLNNFPSRPDRLLAVELRSCVGTRCTPPSEYVFARYPLLYATESSVAGNGSGTATLTWNYPELPPGNQIEVGFRFGPIFPSALVPAQLIPPDAALEVTGIEGELYPGGVGRLEACEFGSGVALKCSNGVLVSFREGQIDPSIPVPTLTINSSGREAVLELPDLTEDFHYLIKEFEGIGTDPVREYRLEHSEFVARKTRGASGGEYGYQAQKCREGQSGEWICSEPGNIVSEQHSYSQTFSRPIGPPSSDPQSANADICWFSEGSLPKLRWSYDWSAGVPVGEFAETPTAFELVYWSTTNNRWITSSVIDVTEFADGRAFFNADSVSWYWESEAFYDPDPKPYWAVRPVVEGRVTANPLGTPPGIGDPPHSGIEVGPYGNLNQATMCAPLDGGNRSGAATPSDLKPGHYFSDRQLRQGWRLFWSSDLRYDEVNESFGRAFDLMAVWYTFKIIDGHWSPVWYYSRLSSEGDCHSGQGCFYSGPLMYPQSPSPSASGPTYSQSDLQVGTVTVWFNGDGAPDNTDPNAPPSPSATAPWIEVDIDHGDGLTGHEIFEMENLGDSANHTVLNGVNEHSHWNGIWTPGSLFNLIDGRLGINSVFSVEWISGDGYSTALNTFDDEGQPIWFIEFNADGNGGQDFGDWKDQTAMLTVFPGYAPFFDATGVNLTQADFDATNKYVEGGGLRRQYDNSPAAFENPRRGEMCWDIQSDIFVEGQVQAHRSVSQSNGDYDHNGGSPRCGDANDSGAVEIHKVASLHYIEVDGPGTCRLGEGLCEYSFSWFTEDQFPNVEPVVRFMEFVGGASQIVVLPLTEFCANGPDIDPSTWGFSVVGQTCVVTDFTYSPQQNPQFALISNHLEDAGTGLPLTAELQPVIAAKTFVINNLGDPPPGAPVIQSEVSAAPSSRSEGANLADELLDAAAVASGATNSGDHAELVGQRGDFSVGQGGAAEYVYPIMTAPAVGGFAPQIALTFNSQSGPGLAGYGWSIAGLPAIMRCGQTWERDFNQTAVELNGNDRFCLEGNRLMLMGNGAYGEAGTEYRLELDNQTRFWLLERGPAGDSVKYFVAQSKDGTVRFYGAPDSAHDSALVSVPDQSGVQLAWPISRLQDASGNYIRFNYAQQAPAGPQVEWLIDSIAYTMNDDPELQASTPHSSIVFEWADLQHSRVSYVAGVPMARSKYLDRVRSVTRSGQTDIDLRVYDLAHGQVTPSNEPIVTELTESYPGGQYLPIIFEWEKFDRHHPTMQQGSDWQSGHEFRGAQAGDVDGDGRAELVVMEMVGTGNLARFRYHDFNVTETTVLEGSLSGAVYTGVEPNEISENGWVLADFHGDGRMGVVYFQKASPTDGNIHYAPWVWDEVAGTGKFEYGYSIGAYNLGIGSTEPLGEAPVIGGNVFIRLSTSDLDGDGMSDVVAVLEPEEGSYLRGVARLGKAFRNPNVRSASPVTSDWEEMDIGLPYDPGIPGTCNSGVIEPIVRSRTEISNAFTLDGSGKAALVAYQAVTGVCSVAREVPGEIQVYSESGLDLFEQPVGGRSVTFESKMGPIEISTEAFSNPIDSNGTGGGDFWEESAQTQFVAEFALEQNDEDRLVPVDFNMDGLTDFAELIDGQAGTNSNETEIRVHINRGRSQGQFQFVLGPSATINVKRLNRGRIRFQDVGGDQYPDIVFIKNGCTGGCRPHYVEGNGSGFEPPLLGQELGPVGFTIDVEDWDQFLLADLVGNGRPDLVRVTKPNGSWRPSWAVARHSGSGSRTLFEPLLALERIEDGFGATTSLKYLPLSSNSVYRRDRLGDPSSPLDSAPIYDVVTSQYVVSSASSSAPQVDPREGQILNVSTGASTSIRYLYTGSKIQGYGRGMLGFRQMATFSPDTNVLTVSEYGQQFPYTGMPTNTTQFYLPNGGGDLPTWTDSHDNGPLPACVDDCNSHFWVYPNLATDFRLDPV